MPSASLISMFDALLSDLDGVVYAGPHAIPGAVEALGKLEAEGVGLGYVTNNASRTPAQVAAHLRDLGAPAEDYQVVSSSQAAAELLSGMLPAGSPVLVTGSPALAHELELVGLIPVRTALEHPVAVVQGFNPEIAWKDLAEASYVVAGGALWVATNTDMSIPQARGIAPGNGTLVAAVASATGQKPLVAGKPEAPLFHAAAKRLGSERPLVVGDRLDTRHPRRQPGRVRHCRRPDGRRYRESILAASVEERPGYLINTLSELYEPYPEVEHRDGIYICRGSHARVDGNTVSISGERADLDSWRAACVAWWAANPGVTTAKVPDLEWLDH